MLKIIREILLKIVNDIDTGNSNLKIAKRFLCDDCRQKLVIEIKEIDKKD